METNIFMHCRSKSEARSVFANLAMKLHPDKGGDAVAFSKLKTDYDTFLDTVDAMVEASESVSETLTSTGMDLILYHPQTGNQNQDLQLPEGIRDQIERVRVSLTLKGINDYTLTLKGSWLWITGLTRETGKLASESLKGLGFRFSGKHKAWYWTATPKRFSKGYRSNYTMSDISMKYGSKTI